VVDRPEDMLGALQRARSRHPEFASVQAEAVAQAFGPIGDQAISNAAGTIASFVGARGARKLVKAA
jgi:hypothetical protein